MDDKPFSTNDRKSGDDRREPATEDRHRQALRAMQVLVERRKARLGPDAEAKS